MNTITRTFALPLISAAIVGGALGLAGPATAAATSTSGNHAIMSSHETRMQAPVSSTLGYHHRHGHNHRHGSGRR